MDVTGQQKEGPGLGFAVQSNGPLAQVVDWSNMILSKNKNSGLVM